jgi:hypothetical protein
MNLLLQRELSPLVEDLQHGLSEQLWGLVLFGSVARGEARESSDLDLLLVADGLPEKFMARTRYLRRLLPTELQGTPTSPYPSQASSVSLDVWYLRGVFGFAPKADTPGLPLALVHDHRWTCPIRDAGDGRCSQVSGEPLCMRALLFDPGGSTCSCPLPNQSMLPSGFPIPSATTRTVLSRLNHAAHMLAVYASRRESPQRRARLATSRLARR